MKRLIQRALAPFGYGCVNTRKLGWEPWRDISILLKDVEAPIFFDVGAHTGQTLTEMTRHFPQAAVHAFEPDPESFLLLQQTARQFPKASIYQLALGDQAQSSILRRNRASMTNSLLAVSRESEASPIGNLVEKVGEVPVTVTTLDEFCSAHDVNRIDFLKTDCQGFDLRVLKGAKGLLCNRKVRVIQCEGMFDSEYVGQGWFYEILHFLTDMGYAPVSFHNLARNSHHEINWADILFKCRQDF
jgi:FkbM family methyltransferase